MKIIALSDTHGQLSYVNKLAKKHNVDAVIHCGDFGFMTHQTVASYPERELSLNIKHWPFLPADIRRQAWDLSRDEKISIIKEHDVLGDFDKYLDGTEDFDVPVYAVWGNHEDVRVIRDLLNGKANIPSLHMVTSQSVYKLDGLHVTGIGGNMSLRKFFDKPYSGNFYPFMTFQEWAELRFVVKKHRKNKSKLWILTHVSPGKHPLLELFGLHILPEIWFSGHMGVPFPHHYSLFTNFDDYQFKQRVVEDLKFTLPLWQQYQDEVATWFELKERIDRLDTSIERVTLDELLRESRYSKYKDMVQIGKQYAKSKSISSIFDDPYPDFKKFQLMRGSSTLFQSVTEDTDEVSSLNDYLSRKSSKWVKKGWYFNLPDVYTDGYVVIDTETSDGGYKVQSYGHL